MINVLLHSSLDHKDLLLEHAEIIVKLGGNPILPDLNRYQHIRDVLKDHSRFDKIKNRLSIENIENVEKCDCLLIVNPNHRGVKNYIGGNSFLEMSIAFYLKKPVLLTHPIPENLPYTEEIKSFYPRVVDLKSLTKETWNSYVKTTYIR